MKLGCATFSYLYECSLDEALGRLAQLGFRHIELTVCPPHVWPREMSTTDRAALRRLFEKHGVQPVVLNPRQNDLNISSIHPGIREESIRYLKESIDLAADLAAPLQLIVPGKPTPLFAPPPEEVWRMAREAVERCVEHGARSGVTCVVENVDFSLCRRARDLKRLASEIGSENCRVHYDVANANMHESPAEGIRELGSWLASVHLSDNDGEVWTHSAIGDGNIDFAAVAAALREVGFAGTSLLEVMVHHDQDAVMRSALQRLGELGWAP